MKCCDPSALRRGSQDNHDNGHLKLEVDLAAVFKTRKEKYLYVSVDFTLTLSSKLELRLSGSLCCNNEDHHTVTKEILRNAYKVNRVYLRLSIAERYNAGV